MANIKEDVFKQINMHNGDDTVCWEWTGYKWSGTTSRTDFRPYFFVNNTRVLAYRLVYELVHGVKLPRDTYVRHTCDNPMCCNPSHLLIGTQKDNMRDMMERERVGLKIQQVQIIMSHIELGIDSLAISTLVKRVNDIDVSPEVVRSIKTRRLYQHVDWSWGDKLRDKLDAKAERRKKT